MKQTSRIAFSLFVVAASLVACGKHAQTVMRKVASPTELTHLNSCSMFLSPVVRSSELAGLVIDQTRTPREGVQVERVTSDWLYRFEGQVTATNGLFKFVAPPGRYNLKFGYEGFATTCLEVQVTPSLKTKLVVITLSLKR